MHVIVMAKSPIAGKVKTRLCPPYTLVQAAEIAQAALVDTLAAVDASDAGARTLALDGPVGSWTPANCFVVPQRGDGLDQRLAAAFDDAGSRSELPLLLIGMDTPQATPELISSAGDLLASPQFDAVLGPAADGGWWALGLQRPDPSLLIGVPMSTEFTCKAQLDRLHRAGLRVGMLPELVDVDDAVSAHRVADLVPSSRFARVLSRQLVAL